MEIQEALSAVIGLCKKSPGDYFKSISRLLITSQSQF